MAEPDVWHTVFARFAPRFLEIAPRGPNAVELAAAIRRSHPGCDPWKTARILGAVVDALEAGHQPTTRQIVDNLDRAGERVSRALVKATVARAQCIGRRTEACASSAENGSSPITGRWPGSPPGLHLAPLAHLERGLFTRRSPTP
jgi:hypothetical protein